MLYSQVVLIVTCCTVDTINSCNDVLTVVIVCIYLLTECKEHMFQRLLVLKSLSQSDHSPILIKFIDLSKYFSQRHLIFITLPEVGYRDGSVSIVS